MEFIKQGQPTVRKITKPIVMRATIIAVLIGSALTLSGQSDAVLGEAKIQLLPMSLAYLTPFLVVIISQVFGIREAHRVLLQKSQNRQAFIQTLFSHGIPLRAVVLGLAAGAVNTFFVATAYLVMGRGLHLLPVELIIQAVTLPIIFGAFSQALSFRSTVRKFTQAGAASQPV